MAFTKGADQMEEYESQIEDVDELSGTDIKINPEFYIHTAVLKAQEALVKENVQVGFLQYRVMVEHIETLCRAAKMLTKESYDEAIEKYKKENEEYAKETNQEVKSVRLATKKLELLMQQVFSAKVTTSHLKA